jgi:hypothetical protein
VAVGLDAEDAIGGDAFGPPPVQARLRLPTVVPTVVPAIGRVAAVGGAGGVVEADEELVRGQQVGQGRAGGQAQDVLAVGPLGRGGPGAGGGLEAGSGQAEDPFPGFGPAVGAGVPEPSSRSRERSTWRRSWQVRAAVK